MNAITTISPLDQVRSLYRKLSQADQLAVMCDLIQGGHRDLNRSDGFIDALIPVNAAFDDTYVELRDCDEEDEPRSFNPSMVHPDDPCQSKGLVA